MTAGAVLEERVAALPPVGLDDVRAVSVLERLDRKHLVHVDALDVMIDELPDGVAVLEVDGERRGIRHSVYFDTPDLATYRAHRQGRRRRFKVRTRHYGQSSAAMLEVKCKGNRGQTAKYRTPHPGPSPEVLSAEGVAFAAATVRRHYGFEPRLDLVPTLETRFVRTALIDLTRGERLTIDRELRVVTGGRTFAFDEQWAIVELKAARRHPTARLALKRAGAKRGRMSKYCLGVAVSHPGVPSNPWRWSLRRLAG